MALSGTHRQRITLHTFWGSATRARGSRAHSVALPLASFTQRAAGARGSHPPLRQRAAGARSYSSLPLLGYKAHTVRHAQSTYLNL